MPYAHVTCVKLPDEVTDDQADFCSDIFPTGYFGVELAEVTPGDTVAVFGCGPVGQFAIVSARLRGAGRILAIDSVESRLAMARAQGAEVIDFEREDPVAAIRDLTSGIGVDRAIDAVGVDANRAHSGTGKDASKAHAKEFDAEVKRIAPKQSPVGPNWIPGDGPSQVLIWAVQALAKAGTLSIIGVYPETATSFPIGKAMGKNLTLKMGNCNHRRFVPDLIDLGSYEARRSFDDHHAQGAADVGYRRLQGVRPPRGWLDQSGADAGAGQRTSGESRLASSLKALSFCDSSASGSFFCCCYALAFGPREEVWRYLCLWRLCEPALMFRI